MKFKSFFKGTQTKKVNPVCSITARREIATYIKYAFENNYKELESSGMLENYIEESEIIYNQTLQILKDTNHNATTYIREEDKIASYINLALTVAFQDINNRLTNFGYK